MTDACISVSYYELGRYMGQCQGGINEGHRRSQSHRTENSGTVHSGLGTHHGRGIKDEWLTIVFSIPLILVFIPSMVAHIQAGFTALATLPTWYHEILMVIVLASFGVKAGKGVMEMLKK